MCYPNSFGRISRDISLWSSVKLVPWKTKTSFALSLRNGFTTPIRIPKILQICSFNWEGRTKSYPLLGLVYEMDSPDPERKKSTEESWSKTYLVDSQISVDFVYWNRQNFNYYLICLKENPSQSSNIVSPAICVLVSCWISHLYSAFYNLIRPL